MSGWTTRPIRDLCSSIIDCVNKTAPVVDGPTPYKMIRTTNVRHGRVDVTNVRYVDEQTYVRWVRRGQPRAGDIVLTREAPLGEVGMLRDPTGVFLGQRLVMYRADPDSADRHFLLYAMRGEDVQSQIRSYGSGSTVEHMRVPDCGELLIRCPGLAEQRRIGAVLAAFDNLIAINERRIELLEQLASSLYREWFVRLAFPGRDHAAWGEVDSNPLPDGWEVRLLGDVAEFVSGSSLTKAAYVDNGYLAFSAAGPDGRLAGYDVDGRGVVLSAVGARCGRTFRAAGRWSAIANTIRYSPRNDSCSSAWLYLATKDPRMWPKRGSAQPFISINDARQVPVVVPDKDTMMRFENSATPVFDLVDVLLDKNRHLAATRDLLLPRLVTGRVDISEVDLRDLVSVEAA